MNNEVIAHIDISTPSGRKIVRELEKKKVVKIEYPLPKGINGKTYSVDEAFQMVEKKLNDHYGTNYKL